MKDWYSSIYKGLIISSIVAFIVGFFSKGNISIDAYITGYATLILGIMMILIILFNNILRVSQGDSTFQLVYTILITTGPFILMLAVIGFILYQIITYKEKIVDNHVSQSYFSFSNITIILMLIQIYIVYTNISTPKFEETGKISKVTSSVIYLLGVLAAISSIIIFTILKYFTTDGFMTIK
jgi:hypothetical protein